MARRKSRGRGKKSKTSWTDLAAHANTAIQMAEPLAPAVAAAFAGDVPGAIAAAKPGLQEAAGIKNVVQVAAGYGLRGAVKRVLRGIGAKNPKFLGRKLF